MTVRALCASQGSQGEHQVVNPVQAALQRQRAQRGAVLPFWQVSHCVMGRVPHPAHCSIQLHNQLQVLTLQAGCDALQLVPVGTLLAHAACSCCFCWSYLLVSCACSRDMWFEVPLPFFLRDNVYGLGWERVAVGAMLAVSTCKLQLGHVSARGGISAPPTRGGERGGRRETRTAPLSLGGPRTQPMLCCVVVLAVLQIPPSCMRGDSQWAKQHQHRLFTRLRCGSSDCVAPAVPCWWCCCAGLHHSVRPGTKLDPSASAAAAEAEPSQQVRSNCRVWAVLATGWLACSLCRV